MKDNTVFALGLASLVAVGAISQVHCTPKQRADIRTALDLSICVQGVVLENVEKDLKDPFVAAAVAEQIADECKHKLPPSKDPE